MMVRTFVRAIAACSLLGGVTACAPPMFVAGHTTDFSEVYTGQGVGGPGSNWMMRGVFSGVTCSGAATPTGLFSSSGNVSCSDGRSARVDNVPYQGLGYWHGQGMFPDGTGISRLILERA